MFCVFFRIDTPPKNKRASTCHIVQYAHQARLVGPIPYTNMATPISFEITITQLATSALNQRVLIQWGIPPAEAKSLQTELIRACMNQQVQDYLLNRQGYRWTDVPMNMTRACYAIRCFYRHHDQLKRISMLRLATMLKKECLEDMFRHFGSAQAVAHAMENEKRRLPDQIRRIIARKK